MEAVTNRDLGDECRTCSDAQTVHVDGGGTEHEGTVVAVWLNGAVVRVDQVGSGAPAFEVNGRSLNLPQGGRSS